jgi:hypothetical protein
MAVINLSAPSRTGRYLWIKKRNYSHWDVFHPLFGFLCKLLSMPKGLQVSNASSECSRLEGSYHQTPSAFERAYLRADV